MDIDNYTMSLHEKLSKLKVPQTLFCQSILCKSEQHSHERDWYVLDLMTTIIETSFECIPISKATPKLAGRKRDLLPGWKQNVLPFKNDSLFWHSLWLSMGKPNNGGVFEVMKHARNKYHFAVRRAKKELQILKSQALAEAAASDNLALFKEMKKHLYSNRSDESIPDSLEGNVTHESILEKFRECYSELYNSAGTSKEMVVIKSEIDKLINLSRNESYYEVKKITPNVVKDAAKLLKPNKTDVSGCYTSDVFLNAPDILFEHLSAVFSIFCFTWNHHKRDSFVCFSATI